MDQDTLLQEYQKALKNEQDWSAHRKKLAHQLSEHFPIPEGKQSKTHKHNDLKIEVKQSVRTSLTDEKKHGAVLNEQYPEAFPMKASFSKTGFKKLPADVQKTIQLSGMITTTISLPTVKVSKDES